MQLVLLRVVRVLYTQYMNARIIDTAVVVGSTQVLKSGISFFTSVHPRAPVRRRAMHTRASRRRRAARARACMRNLHSLRVRPVRLCGTALSREWTGLILDRMSMSKVDMSDLVAVTDEQRYLFDLQGEGSRNSQQAL